MDSYLYNLSTSILEAGHDDLGDFIIPEQTIFHPQGGGQPADEGYFTVDNKNDKYHVYKIVERSKDSYIKHYFTAPSSIDVKLLEKQKIDMLINKDARLLYAKYHTAGHFIANIVEKKYPLLFGTKGNHFPGKGCVIFTRKDKANKKVEKNDFAEYKNEEVKKYLEEELATSVVKNIPIHIEIDDNNPRTVQIEGMSLYPCGGTHLQNINQLEKGIQITKVSFKKKEGLKVSYSVQ